MRRLSFAVAAALAAGLPAAAAELPLPRGFYVAADTACGQASMATLTLLHRDGIGGAQDFCGFEQIVAEAAGRFRITERCADLRDPTSAEVNEVVYEMLGAGHFRKTSPYGWSVESRHCAQGDLPEPWRSNDIADVLE